MNAATHSAMTHHARLLPLAFRNTAATVVELADQATPRDFTSLRDRCDAQHDALRRELTAAGHLPDVVRDALYTQCALLDEAALGRLEGSARDAWEREPLQVRKFQSNDAGIELISLIERRLAESKPPVALLLIFNAAFGLGFKGKFAINGVEARVALMHAIDQRLDQAIERDTSGTVVVRPPKAQGRMSLPIGAFSPLATVMLACIVAGVIYLALGQWLSASIASMARLAN